MAAEENAPTMGSESEVRRAISAFEQILAVMPTDRTSLEAVAHAYEEIGATEESIAYWVRLGEVLLDEGDTQAVEQALEHLKPYAKSNPEVESLFARMVTHVYDRNARVGSGAGDGDVGRPRGAGSVDAELSFAWDIKEAGELSEEEYASIAEDLTELSATDAAATVSVMHVLEARGFKNLERIVQLVSKECRMPFINLSFFDIKPEVHSLLPMEFCVQRGVLPFGTLGDEVQVVVMNPYHKRLHQEVDQRIGKRCHFFLALPSDFDAALTRISGAALEAAAEEADAAK